MWISSSVRVFEEYDFNAVEYKIETFSHPLCSTLPGFT